MSHYILKLTVIISEKMTTPYSTAISRSYEEFLQQSKDSATNNQYDEESEMYFALGRASRPASTSPTNSEQRSYSMKANPDSTDISSDSEDDIENPLNLSYGKFNGLGQRSIFFHIENMEKLFKMRHTPKKIKKHILTNSLTAEIQLCFPTDANYPEMKEMLIKKYGGLEKIQDQMIEQHKTIGKIPRKTGSDEPTDWYGIKMKTGNHLQIIYETKRLFEKYQTNACYFPNFDYVETLMSLLGDDDRVKIYPQKPKKKEDLYEMIIEYMQNTNAIAEEMYKQDVQA